MNTNIKIKHGGTSNLLTKQSEFTLAFSAMCNFFVRKITTWSTWSCVLLTILKQHCGRKKGLTLSTLTEKIKKAVAGYLSAYLQKSVFQHSLLPDL